jgi:hypothetical protein
MGRREHTTASGTEVGHGDAERDAALRLEFGERHRAEQALERVAKRGCICGRSAPMRRAPHEGPAPDRRGPREDRRPVLAIQCGNARQRHAGGECCTDQRPGAGAHDQVELAPEVDACRIGTDAGKQQLQQAGRVIAADAATVEREHPIGLGLSTVVARHDPGPSIPLRSDHTINVGQAFDPLSTGGAPAFDLRQMPLPSAA